MKVRPTTRLEWEVKDESNAIVTTRPPQRDALLSRIENVDAAMVPDRFHR
jgi:hypothetical protein